MSIQQSESLLKLGPFVVKQSSVELIDLAAGSSKKEVEIHLSNFGEPLKLADQLADDARKDVELFFDRAFGVFGG